MMMKSKHKIIIIKNNNMKKIIQITYMKYINDDIV